MDLKLNGKVAVVTGASKGIGLAVSIALASEGVRVVAGARTPTAELETLDAVVPVAVDLARAGGPEQLIDRAVEEFGGVDILINNVGKLNGPHFEGFLSVSDEVWQDSLDANLFSAIRASRAALPHIIARGGGSIINISSVNAFRPDPSIIDYSASKAALTSLSKTLSMEFGPQGVRVNAISPGPVRTPMQDELGDILAAAMDTDRAGAHQALIDGLGGVSINTFTEPEEIAALVLFLVSNRVGARLALAPPTPPGMRVRTGRFAQHSRKRR